MELVLTDCWCDRWKGTSCAALATQEDLLCDNCRKGCHLIKYGEQEPFHGYVSSFKFAVTPPRL